uniref:Major facilitator superfamily (MFS) profile domain-containing protein n=1 Tax=Kalanchoe fedtschenkoi TaxID=63787 RepID=A0A7N0UWW4_KALFE
MRGMAFPKRYLIVILTFICTSVCYIERVGFSIAYTIAADTAGVNQSSKGVILSTFYYGYACSQVPGGWVAQRIGGRRVLLFSFLLWSLICALVPSDPNKVVVLVMARMFVGAARGFIFPSIHTVLAQWVPPHERSRSVSLTTSGMYLGAAAGMLLLPSLIKLKGPQSVFSVEALLGVMWSVLWLNYASDPPRSEHPKATASGFGETLLPLRGSQKSKAESGGTSAAKIQWKRIMLSMPGWAIVVNNFTFSSIRADELAPPNDALPQHVHLLQHRRRDRRPPHHQENPIRHRHQASASSSRPSRWWPSLLPHFQRGRCMLVHRPRLPCPGASRVRGEPHGHHPEVRRHRDGRAQHGRHARRHIGRGFHRAHPRRRHLRHFQRRELEAGVLHLRLALCFQLHGVPPLLDWRAEFRLNTGCSYCCYDTALATFPL